MLTEGQLVFFGLPQYRTDQQDIIDKNNIRELVEFERYCRDRALWDLMEQCYVQDSRIQISWFSGSGNEFVKASKGMPGATHKINNTIVWLKNDKGIAEAIASIHLRHSDKGIEYDVISYVRLLFKVVKIESIWKIATMDCIYEKDTIIPVVPCKVLQISSQELLKYRYSYRCLSYVLSQRGELINDNLPGEDAPETIADLYEKASEWILQ
jgi:hypothetical protein